MHKEIFIIYRRNVKTGESTYSPKSHSTPHFDGSHCGGGTVNVDIPKGWFNLSCDVFLERVITLSAAKHYGFTVDELKEFFGFTRKYGRARSKRP
jgi:hypothetical protein